MRLQRALARLHGSQLETASLNLRAPEVLHKIIEATQQTRLGPYVTPQTFELSAEDGQLASGEREHADGARFFANFPATETVESLRALRVLDLGCGYGGRTVWYAEQGDPESVVGIEISPRMVDRCRAFSDSRGVSNVTFEVGVAEELNFDEGSFDAVISYDVLEHVDDPARAFTEIGRVLRPGGCAWLVFPTYLGARSAHLDYLTQVPLLHRVFAPETIIPVVNRFLAADPARYGVRPQPPPRVTAVGRRALPTLNGMSLDDAKSWLRRAGLATSWARIEPLFRPDAPLPLAGPLSRAMARAAEAGHLPEVLVWHLACKVHRT